MGWIPKVRRSMVIHGGGIFPKDLPDFVKQAYRYDLDQTLSIVKTILD